MKSLIIVIPFLFALYACGEEPLTPPADAGPGTGTFQADGLLSAPQADAQPASKGDATDAAAAPLRGVEAKKRPAKPCECLKCCPGGG
jgi:hypothetical protein